MNNLKGLTSSFVVHLRTSRERLELLASSTTPRCTLSLALSFLMLRARQTGSSWMTAVTIWALDDNWSFQDGTSLGSFHAFDNRQGFMDPSQASLLMCRELQSGSHYPCRRLSSKLLVHSNQPYASQRPVEHHVCLEYPRAPCIMALFWTKKICASDYLWKHFIMRIETDHFNKLVGADSQHEQDKGRDWQGFHQHQYWHGLRWYLWVICKNYK